MLEEIIIVYGELGEEVNEIAKDYGARIFYYQNENYQLKSEAGAFEAKGEILFFIKQNHFPPKDFVNRIKAAVSKNNEIGILQDNIIALICKYLKINILESFFLRWIKIDNIFISRRIFYFGGGLKFKGELWNYRDLFFRKSINYTGSAFH